jgi:hypothetical protein
MAVLTNFGLNVEGANEGATLMPKLQYRFRVTFTNLGGNAEGPLVTKNVVSVTRPALDHDDVTIDTYNSKIRLAGKHMWQDITLVLRDDVDGNVVKSIGQQMSRQVNHSTQTSRRAGSNYKFSMKIEMLDGTNDGSEASVLDSWELVGAFIPSIQYGDLNYGSSDMVQITATIRYDNASHTVDGSDTLSNTDAANDSSISTVESAGPQ